MEMHAMISSSPRRIVEEIFKDYNARRAGIVRALTFDVDELYSLCDPEKENLCLYGHPNESWEVTLPAEEVPPELPELALGINFARDGMTRRDWLSLITVHSDSWLLTVAFYFGAQLNRNESEMGAHFLPCGRFLASCVACMLPHLEGDPGSHTQFHQDVMGAVATSPTRHPISAHQVMYELRIYSLEEAT